MSAETVAARSARYERLWSSALAGFSEEQLGDATAVLERVIEMFEEIERGSDGRCAVRDRSVIGGR